MSRILVRHVLSFHPLYQTKSKFLPGLNFQALLKFARVRQHYNHAEGFIWHVKYPEFVGQLGRSDKLTRFYTVVTDHDYRLITLFPGIG